MDLSNPWTETFDPWFIGRRHELAWIDQWLARPRPPSQIVLVLGPPGIGKSTFLDVALHRARQRDTATLWLDARLCPTQPLGFLQFWRSWQWEHWHQATIESVAAHQPVVIAVDNFEELRPIESWLGRYVSANTPKQGVLWLLASRVPPGPNWHPSGALPSAVWPLDPWSSGEVTEFLNQRGIPVSSVWHEISGGIPLTLEVLTAMPAPDWGDYSESVERPSVAARDLAARIWDTVTDDDTRRALVTLALIPRADEELLAGIVGTWTPALPRALRAAGIVRVSPYGYAMHDEYRPWLRMDARFRWPDAYERIRRRTYDRVVLRMHRSSGPHRVTWAGTLLSLMRDGLPTEAGYADLTDYFDLTAVTPTPEEPRLLHQYLDAWGLQPLPLRDRQALHAVLDGLLERFPESARVYHWRSGRPAAFFLPILLHHDVLTVLEPFLGPVEAWIRETRDAVDRPWESADTFFGGLLGIDPDLPREDHPRWVGLLIRDSLSLLAGHMRAYLLGTVAPFIALLEALGFEPVPPGRPDPAGGSWYVLDLRQRDFGEWLLSVAGTLWVPPPEPLSAEAWRELLEHWRDATWLEAFLPARQRGLDPATVQRRVHALLSNDLASLALRPEDQALLRDFYLLRDRETADDFAARHFISRATLYRRLRQAVTALAAAAPDL